LMSFVRIARIPD